MQLAPMEAARALDREFLQIRARILELAADLDRLDRGAGSLEGDQRMEQIRQALEVLLRQEPGRAEAVQMIFSRPYDPQWKTHFRPVPKPR